jgi:methionyl-tRNA formyltransferase
VLRVVLLAPGMLNGFGYEVVRRVLAHRRSDVVGCVIDARRPPPLRTRIRRHLQRGRGGYVLIIGANAVRRRWRRSALRNTTRLLAAAGVPVIETAQPYSAETAEAVARLEPDVLLLVGGFGIVKEPLLSLSPEGVVSYHHGDMRRYRGQPAAFWELYNGESSMGVTVQRLAAGIDCGEPIVERRFEIRPDDTFRSLSHRIYRGSADMVLEAIERVEAGTNGTCIEPLGALYSLPNLRQWLTFQVRVATRVTLARARSLVSSSR